MAFDYNTTESFRLDGTMADLKSPAWAVPVAYLPDGRLLAVRTVFGQAQPTPP